jgi:PAS domain S-box-containing protein
MRQDSVQTAAELFPGDGEMLTAVRTKDWGATLLGPVSEWPPELRTAASICLYSNFQMAICWGPDLVYLYNDAMIPIFGDKHPWALGQRVADVWPEAWNTVGPMLQSVLATGKAARSDDMLLVLERRGFPEEIYFTLSYSAIRTADGAVGGVFVTTMETSGRVIDERRQRTLGDLATQAAQRFGDDEPLDLMRQALARNPHDLPLAALFLTYANGALIPLFGTGMADLGDPAGRAAMAGSLAQLAAACRDARAPQVFEGDALVQWGRPGGVALRQLVALPLGGAERHASGGILLLGVSPRAQLDGAMRPFFDNVAAHVANALAQRSHLQMARIRRAAIEQEDALRRQIAEVRHDLASVLAGTSDTFVSLDRELRILAVNEAALAAIGLPRGEVLGQVLTEVVPDLVGSVLEATLRAVIDGGRPGTAEYQNQPTGSWHSARCYPAPHGAILFGNDITVNKQAEQALVDAHAELERRVEQRTEELREANQLLAAVFDRAPGGIAIAELDGTLVRVNAAYAALTGYAAHELPERPASQRIEADDLARLYVWLARLVAGECESFEVEMRYRLPDGRKVWVSTFFSLIEDAWRGKRYFVGMARDITERKRVEAERQTAQQELRVLYERLQTVRESERTALAREVHDQLGQILSAAKIDIKLLEDDLRLGKTPMARDNIVAELGSASGTLDRAIVLVREIATELRAPELDEHGLYAAIGWHARDFERRTRIACEVRFDAARPHPSRPAAAALLRIFQEALTNVLRHAHAGTVWISLNRRGRWLVLRVRDDGAGIARGRLRAGGSLGLQGMRERAELVDGKLLVGPLAPRGTLVSVRVPLATRKGKP